MTPRPIPTCLLMFTAFTLGLAGCGPSSGPPDPALRAALVGKWKDEAGDRTLTFTDDGRMVTEVKGVTFPTTYTWIGPHRIDWGQEERASGIGSGGGRATVAIDADALTLNITLMTIEGRERSDGGGVSKFRRVQ